MGRLRRALRFHVAKNWHPGIAPGSGLAAGNLAAFTTPPANIARPLQYSSRARSREFYPAALMETPVLSIRTSLPHVSNTYFVFMAELLRA